MSQAKNSSENSLPEFTLRKQKNYGRIVATSLLLSLVGLSSCGKSKEIKSSPPPTAQVTPAQSQPTAAQTSAEQTRGGRSGTQASSADTTTAQPENGSSSSEVLPAIPGEIDNGGDNTTAASSNDATVASTQQKTTRAYQVKFDQVNAVKTGGLQNNLFYTAAGDDEVMNEFKSYGAKVSKEQQVMNLNLAKAIVLAKLNRNDSSGQMSLQLTIDEFGVLKTYRLTASADGSGGQMKLALSTKGTSGEMEFQGGFLKCLDSDGGCDAAYAKMKFAGGYTRVIFRNSSADVHYLLQENVSAVEGFSLWSKYILNAANVVQTSAKISSVELSSFEVVNGKSAMAVLIKTDDQEAVGLSVPLLVSAQGASVSSAITKTSDVSKNFDLSSNMESKSNLSDKINQASLVNNDGRGRIKIQLQLGTQAQPASVWMVLAREQKPILSIQAIRDSEK